MGGKDERRLNKSVSESLASGSGTHMRAAQRARQPFCLRIHGSTLSVLQCPALVCGMEGEEAGMNQQVLHICMYRAGRKYSGVTGDR